MLATQTKLSGVISDIVLKRIATDRLLLPAMPSSAMRCLRLVNQADYTNKQVVAVLETDPMLAARVLRLAQSAAMGAQSKVKGLDVAVNRLGAQRLRSALLEYATNKLFEPRDPRIASAFQGLWEHSLAVAILARDLCAFAVSQLDSEMVYLAGLLHDVGKPVLGSMMLEIERSLRQAHDLMTFDADTWMEVVGQSHRPIGVSLAEKWKLPEETIQAIRDAGDYDATNRHSIGNYVRFANAVVKKEGIYVGPFDESDNDALLMIGRSLLGIGEEIVTRASTGLIDRVHSSAA